MPRGQRLAGARTPPPTLRGDDLRNFRSPDLDGHGKGIDVASRQALCIPRKADHRLDNNTTQDATVLCLVTPAAIGPQFFRECADVINTAGSGLPDRAKMAEIMHRFGLTPAAPPG